MCIVSGCEWGVGESLTYVCLRPFFSSFVGVTKASEILFITDIAEEATAALAAGYRVLLSVRPGNAPLPNGGDVASVKRITSFDQVDEYLK